ncbi:MAG: MotA/TolQ/ExbB proton channel family protein [Steroidobacteraceae bacterium]
MRQSYARDRLWTIGLLLGVAVIVQTAYALYIRPHADAWLAEQVALREADPDYKPRRTLSVVLKDAEQEVAIILGLWALGLSVLKARALSRHRRQLDRGLMKVPPGYRILPTDVREYTRRLDELPPAERDLIPARVTRRALKRFGETENVQDAATAVHDYCESEAARLDSELALIRFSVWAIPAVGFVGTVRGIGEALAGAQTALKGDTGPVTSGLGIAFNSTFVALITSIILMYVIHELQLRQERLVLDTEQNVDDTVVSNLQSR